MGTIIGYAMGVRWSIMCYNRYSLMVTDSSSTNRIACTGVGTSCGKSCIYIGHVYVYW